MSIALSMPALAIGAGPAQGADVWTQIGSDIEGVLDDERSGTSVSLSSDGSVMAIGAYLGGGGNRGQVRVFEWDGTSWVQRGTNIDGEVADESSGFSVDLSDDGTVVAIGAFTNTSRTGLARVYEWNGSAWSKRGQDLAGEAIGDEAGWSVSLSADGNTVAVGAYKNDDGGTNAGHVRVYTYGGSTWTQLGSDLDGEDAGDYFGYSVSLAGDGRTLAVGARLNSDAAARAGHVRVFQWSGGAWNQLGSDLNGQNVDDYFGNSVALSSDGTRLAVGIPFDDTVTTDAGAVTVYEYSGGNWSAVGTSINGYAANSRAGWAVSLSGDGSVVALGNSNPSTGFGLTQVYSWNGGSWTQFGGDISGEHPLDGDGGALQLSSDGSVIAIGASANDDSGRNAGQARAFSFSGVPGSSGGSSGSSGSGGSSNGPRYVDFQFLLPDGRECTAISPVRVRVGYMYQLPGFDASCQTVSGATVAGWTIPVSHGFTGYGSSSEPFPPGLSVRVVDSQRFTLVPKEPVLQIDYDANIAERDACVQTKTLHTSNAGRVQHVWVPREDISLGRLPTSSPCMPDGHELMSWNTSGDGSGDAYAPGAQLPDDWAEDPTNIRRLYAMWTTS